MAYLTNLVYLFVLLLASPWLVYQAARTGKYREGFAEKFLGLAPMRKGNRTCLWFHAVSVGEVNLIAPLVAAIRREHADWECVISATSRTGMAQARRKYPDCTVFYCPLDFSWAARAAMRRVRPNCLVLAELELWPNLIRAAGESGASVAIVNGRLSERSFRGYRRLGWIVRSALSRVELIAAQNSEYAERFRSLGAAPNTVHITGSLKFDGAVTDRANPTTIALRRAAGIAPEDVVFLAGSTQQPEEMLALAAYSKLRERFPRLRLILVPRHPERFEEVAAQLDAAGANWQRRSRLSIEGARPDARVWLVDAMGELGGWWGAADVAFVGGSIHKRGGQNMIEPAAYGAAVSFGPNTRNFRDIVSQLLSANAAVVVRDGEELTAFVERCLSDRAYAQSLGARAKEFVSTQLGATRRTLALLEEVIEPSIADVLPFADRSAA
ncbi:MAG TPA: 3-deoxy-D-manno-octulosonic acid transferase [Pirellulales bacterium]